MKRLIKRFGKLITASFFMMTIGIVLFLLTPLLYSNFGIDTDVIGLIVFVTGLAVLVYGIGKRGNIHGWKGTALMVIAVILCFPILILVITTIYFLITGKEVGV